MKPLHVGLLSWAAMLAFRRVKMTQPRRIFRRSVSVTQAKPVAAPQVLNQRLLTLEPCAIPRAAKSGARYSGSGTAVSGSKRRRNRSSRAASETGGPRNPATTRAIVPVPAGAKIRPFQIAIAAEPPKPYCAKYLINRRRADPRTACHAAHRNSPNAEPPPDPARPPILPRESCLASKYA